VHRIATTGTRATLRTRATLAALTLAAVVLLPSAPAAAVTKVQTEIPPMQDVVFRDLCDDHGFSVRMTDRGGRTLTSYLDDDGTLLRQEITGSLVTEFTNDNVSGGPVISIETIGTTTITPRGDGTSKMVQKGSGFALDLGTHTGEPSLVWFTGRVTSTGFWDDHAVLLDVLTQKPDGLTSDICEMLVTGLKTRH
jgi:hypothetical protein